MKSWQAAAHKVRKDHSPESPRAEGSAPIPPPTLSIHARPAADWPQPRGTAWSHESPALLPGTESAWASFRS
jgi:hypothetical protein